MRKLALISLSAIAALSVGTAANAAQFIGTTTGCFGLNCTPGTSEASLSGLTFNGGSFNQADADGYLGLGGLTDNLGTFTLSTLPTNYSSEKFTLFVNFTSPAGSGSTSVPATLIGNVKVNSAGGLTVNFNNDPIAFNPAGGAPFTLSVNDVAVTAGAGAQAVNGQILTSTPAVPEPATWGMMLIGFGAIGAAMRRKQASQGTRGRVRFNFA
jgi:hypothetical protein